MASGGYGSYAYNWEYSSDGWNWYSVSTGSSHSQYFTGGESSFTLRLTVTSGGQTAVTQHEVTVGGGCGGPLIC